MLALACHPSAASGGERLHAGGRGAGLAVEVWTDRGKVSALFPRHKNVSDFPVTSQGKSECYGHLVFLFNVILTQGGHSC